MSERDPKTNEAPRSPRLDAAALIIALAVVMMLFGFFLFNAYIAFAHPESIYFKEVEQPHLASFLMIPQGAALSYAIVLFLRQTEGPFAFKVAGVEANGASGQVVMWVFAYLVLIVSLRLVW